MKLFTQHPEDSKLTYFQHAKWALWSGVRLILAGMACLVHSVLPFLFENYASRVIRDLSQELDGRE